MHADRLLKAGSWSGQNTYILLARDMQSALYYVIARQPVRPSVTRVDQSRTVEVKIVKFSPIF